MDMMTQEGTSQQWQQEAIIKTADDAILSKLQASSFGYYKDSFLPHLAQHASGLTSSSSINDDDDERKGRYHHRATHLGSSFPTPTPSPCPPFRRHLHNPPRSAGQPLIRRGTYARVCCIDRAVASFLSLSLLGDQRRKQIVVLGAGKDTLYLRYKNDQLTTLVTPTNDNSISNSNNNDNNDNNDVYWYDIDFPCVISTKKILLQQIYSKNSSATTITNNINTTTNNHYHLIGHDLRLHCMKDFLLEKMVKLYNFDINMPTLFILECVQMYLPDETSRNILQTISQLCTRPIVILYDPIPLNDSFGQVMLNHLCNAGVIVSRKERINSTVGKDEKKCHGDIGIDREFNNKNDCRDITSTTTTTTTTTTNKGSSSSIYCISTLQDQINRLVTQCGFPNVIGCDMMDAYETILTLQQRHVANKIEMLDEMEEFILIMKHYCFVVATADGENTHEIADKYLSIGPQSALGFVEGRCIVR